MKLNRFVTLAAVALLAVGAIGTLIGVTRIAAAASAADDEPPITGDAFDRASAAALAHTGGGTVTETEVGDEDGYYEVEVTLADGQQVDVHLDEAFKVIGQETGGDGPNDRDRPNDD